MIADFKLKSIKFADGVHYLEFEQISKDGECGRMTLMLDPEQAQQFLPLSTKTYQMRISER